MISTRPTNILLCAYLHFFDNRETIFPIRMPVSMSILRNANVRICPRSVDYLFPTALRFNLFQRHVIFAQDALNLITLYVSESRVACSDSIKLCNICVLIISCWNIFHNKQITRTLFWDRFKGLWFCSRHEYVHVFLDKYSPRAAAEWTIRHARKLVSVATTCT